MGRIRKGQERGTEGVCFFVGVEKLDFPHLCVKLNIKKPAERIVGLRLAYMHTYTHTHTHTQPYTQAFPCFSMCHTKQAMNVHIQTNNLCISPQIIFLSHNIKLLPYIYIL